MPVDDTLQSGNKTKSNKTNQPIQIPVGATSRAFYKLWICDVHLMIPSPVKMNAYVFRGRHVEYLIVFGTVTRVQPLGPTKILYEVDDGTGHMNCVYDHFRQLDSRTRSIMNDVETFGPCIQAKDATLEDVSTCDIEEDPENAKKICLDWLKRKVSWYKTKIKDTFSLGDTICAKGKVNEFRGQREMTVYELHQITNLKDETSHILEMVYLYENEYKKFYDH